MHAARSAPTRWRRIWRALRKQRSAHAELERAVAFATLWGARVCHTDSDGTRWTTIQLQITASRWLSVSDVDLIACVRTAREHIRRDALRGLA